MSVRQRWGWPRFVQFGIKNGNAGRQLQKTRSGCIKSMRFNILGAHPRRVSSHFVEGGGREEGMKRESWWKSSIRITRRGNGLEWKDILINEILSAGNTFFWGNIVCYRPCAFFIAAVFSKMACRCFLFILSEEHVPNSKDGDLGSDNNVLF